MIKEFLVTRKTIGVGFCILFLSLVLGLNAVFAQTSLPAGGSSFETAVLLSPGTYQGGPLEGWQTIYYSIQIKAGQNISVEAGSFSESGCTIYIYNEAQEELKYNYDTNPKISWLSGNHRSSKYYLVIKNDASAVESFSLRISLTNYYDANSQTDAADAFDTPLNIAVGKLSGYLVGSPGIMSEPGDDTKDIYEVSLQKGITYNFKLTPPSKTELTLSLYDSNRQLLKEESSENKGAIVSLSLVPSANTNVFVSVFNNCYNYQDELVNYQLEIAPSVPLTKFYTCTAGYCESVGEFTTKEACQTATTKTCHTSATCNGQCEGGEPLPGCTKNSDCPTGASCVNGQCIGGGELPVPACQDECTSGQTKCFDNFNYYKCGDYNKDDCLEWSTPVYCGEGNKCQNGKCTKTVGCQCSKWQGTECGVSGCSETQIAKTRVCLPAACDTERTCQDDPSCQIIPVIPTPPLPPEGSQFGLFKGLGIGSWFGGWHLILWVLFYIYLAVCLQVLAKKTATANAWMAWVPIASIFLMINIAKKPLWWFILILIPLVNIVIGVILWMAIANRRGKPNWMGILIIAPFVGLAVPGYLAFFDYKSSEKVEVAPPYAPTGTEEANKPTVGYKHPCKYCEKLIPPDSTACPYCGKVNPLGPSRCPKCHEPIEKDWKVCARCNLDLRIACPFCGKITFFGEHCEDCGARLLVLAPIVARSHPP